MHYETSKFILSSFTIGRFTHIECLPGDHSEVYNQDVCSTVPSWTLKKSTFRGFWAPNAKKWYKIHTTLHLGLWTYHVYSTWALKMYGYNFSCGLRKTKTLKMAIGPTFCGMGVISFITLLSRKSLAGAKRHAFHLLHVENKFIVVKPLR